MYLSKTEIEVLLSKKDLTQESNNCISLLLDIIKSKLNEKYNLIPKIERGKKIISLEDNYYNLGYGNNEITLNKRYTKYIDENTILRTQMSSVIPNLLRKYSKESNEIWLCPGLVYRRDIKDKTHIGEPHQLDIWYITKEEKNRSDLLELVQIIISIIEQLKGKKIKWRYSETSHHYTNGGIEVEIYHNNKWLELLECGLISKNLLRNYTLNNYSGLALGLGLERLVMIIKNISDIRVLYSSNELIKKQLVNLKKYKEISNQPSIKRDLSVAVDKNIIIENLTESILLEIPEYLSSKIESISLIKEYQYNELPNIAIERLGMSSSQKNLLIRVELRDLIKTLTNEEANNIYSIIYSIVHKGDKGYLI